MGIWIRSQDKEKLVKSDRIQIDVEYVIELKNNFISIISLDNSNNYCILGTYSTKEKALKVLDMIEKKIIHNEDLFGMPDDEDVE